MNQSIFGISELSDSIGIKFKSDQYDEEIGTMDRENECFKNIFALGLKTVYIYCERNITVTIIPF